MEVRSLFLGEHMGLHPSVPQLTSHLSFNNLLTRIQSFLLQHGLFSSVGTRSYFNPKLNSEYTCTYNLLILYPS